MDELELDASEMPARSVDAHIKHLRSLTPTTDAAKLAAVAPRSKAVAPAFCALANALADYIDVMRINGFSVGEALATANTQLIEPIADAPYIDTVS